MELVRWCWEQVPYLPHLGLLKNLGRAVGNVLQCEGQQRQFHSLERPDSLKSLRLLATAAKAGQRQEQQLRRSHFSYLQTTGWDQYTSVIVAPTRLACTAFSSIFS